MGIGIESIDGNRHMLEVICVRSWETSRCVVVIGCLVLDQMQV